MIGWVMAIWVLCFVAWAAVGLAFGGPLFVVLTVPVVVGNLIFALYVRGRHRG